jgi:ABC-type molybdate transport system permease subunit
MPGGNEAAFRLSLVSIAIALIGIVASEVLNRRLARMTARDDA